MRKFQQKTSEISVKLNKTYRTQNLHSASPQQQNNPMLPSRPEIQILDLELFNIKQAKKK